MSKNNQNKNHKHPIILITGGAGFLGKNIIKELLGSDSILIPEEIRVLDEKPLTGPYKQQVNFIPGDVRDSEIVNSAGKGVDLVIHCAAIIDWGTKDEDEVLAVNVGGTENVIEACRINKIKNLIFTSSLDAVYTGKPLVNINEDQPYPKSRQNAYCRSKTLSEKTIMAVNSESLKTCILRPSDIYGEEDPFHIEPLINMAESGFYIRLGNGRSKCQHVYVGNMAHAHVLAAKALLKGNSKIDGNAYFITDGPGENFFKFFDNIVRRAGYRIWPNNLWMPRFLAFPLASLTEFGAWLISPIKKVNVKFSRFAVAYTCTDFTFNSKRAAADFGFIPKYSLEEGLEKTVKYYQKPE